MQPDSAAPHHQNSLHSMMGAHALQSAAHSFYLDGKASGEGFSIHAAQSDRHCQAAHRLVHHRYVQRGYRREQQGSDFQAGNLLTLSAVDTGGVTLGTLGIRFDTSRRLSADGAFADEMAVLRAQGRPICEFTQLALDDQAASKPVLAALFHTAYLHAYLISSVELLVIEVNPRHVPYYRRMLDFKVCSEVRTNLHVHAPAVLMSLELAHAEQQIARLGGHPEMAGAVRSLYPLFYSPMQEAQVLARMTQEYRLAA